MQIARRFEAPNAILEMVGRFDAQGADEALQAIESVTSELRGDLILDLEHLDYLSSAGVRVLLVAQGIMEAHSGRLRIVNVRPFVRRVLELCRITHLIEDGDEVVLRVWGARGSFPTPIAPDTVEAKIAAALARAKPKDLATADRFVKTLPPTQRGTVGGNTACVELRLADRLFILDAGTGIHGLGIELMKGAFGKGKGSAFLLLSHRHRDHIMGLPFFAPAYVPGNRFEVCGGHADLMDALREQQRPEFFPVPLDDMGAEFTCHRLIEGEDNPLAGIRVDVLRMDHPGDSFGYRLEYADRAIVYATDVEIKEFNPKALKRYIEFFATADILILDGQYSLQESVAKADWGHTSPLIGAELAAEAKVKQLLLFHHDPQATDEQLEESLDTTRDYLRHTAPESDCAIDLAREGLEITL